MKIKIIDLLNKIANNEEVPKKIKWEDFELEWEEIGYHDYKFLDTGNHLLFQGFETSVLNDEVEIIDEAKEDKIQKIYHCETGLTQNEVEIFITENLNQMVDKINELIDEINNLKEND